MKKLLPLLALTTPLASPADVINMFDVFASSREDWSTTGTQGENGWTYGYYDNTNNPNVFVPFDQALHWNANNWDHGFNGGANTNAPWTSIQRTSGHPNTTAFTNAGVADPGPDFHAVRRYTVPAGVSGQVGIDWHVLKNNGNGTGVTGNILHNGSVIDTRTIGGSDNTGATAGTGFTTVSVSPGDFIDIALTPDGAGGAGDASDASNFAMDIGFISPTNSTLIADSVADWTTNATQGENGWSYGYFDVTNSGSAVGDFIPFDAGMWNGGANKWDIGGGAPWTEVGETAGHPNGLNNGAEHWATRRYEIGTGEAGDLYVEFSFGASNRGGAGVGLNILHNGSIVAAHNIDGNDAAGMNRSVLIPGAQEGDIIDIALTPVGANGNTADGSDGSFFSASIYVVPEPGTLGLISLAGLALILRRRR